MSRNINKYDPGRSYEWNYDNAPSLPTKVQSDSSDSSWQRDFCGVSVAGPIGIAAGPLLNSHWLLHYAHLGYDVLTYKTVRSRYRPCYPQPNLQPIVPAEIDHPGTRTTATEQMCGSWAISFGMPSKEPSQWRDDIEFAREHLPSGKALSVSVVATPEPNWSLQQIANDYAQCAQWAAESGAHAVELNFSCPNVSSADGQLYQNSTNARQVLEVVRERVPDSPLIIKIGFMDTESEIVSFCTAIDGLVDAVSMTNCISAQVRSGSEGTATTDKESRVGQLLFDGQPRGIGGTAILEASIRQVSKFRDAVASLSRPPRIIGVGGVSTAEHVERYLLAGAHHVHIATAAMLNPTLGQRIRSELS